MNKKIICFDLDNTLCKTEGNFYKNSKPVKNKILLVNKLYDKGYIIKIFTARFMGRSNENIKKATNLGYNFTKIQLKKWGVTETMSLSFAILSPADSSSLMEINSSI